MAFQGGSLYELRVISDGHPGHLEKGHELTWSSPWAEGLKRPLYPGPFVGDRDGEDREMVRM